MRSWSGGNRDGTGTPVAEGQPLEAVLEALEAIVARLEAGALGLEEALETFEAGVTLARQCEARLDRAERRVELLLRNPDGSFRAEPFPDGASRADAEPPGGGEGGDGSPVPFTRPARSEPG